MPRLIAAEPQLAVTDLEAARAFYVEKLGFVVAFSWGEPAFYMQVRRDGAALNLRLVHGPLRRPAEEADLLAATITTDDAEGLCRTFEDRGVTFRQPLRREPWGAKTFIVADPDGNLVCFAG